MFVQTMSRKRPPQFRQIINSLYTHSLSLSHKPHSINSKHTPDVARPVDSPGGWLSTFDLPRIASAHTHKLSNPGSREDYRACVRVLALPKYANDLQVQCGAFAKTTSCGLLKFIIAPTLIIRRFINNNRLFRKRGEGRERILNLNNELVRACMCKCVCVCSPGQGYATNDDLRSPERLRVMECLGEWVVRTL